MELTLELVMIHNNGGKTFHGHEPNNNFVAYYQNGNRLGNKYSEPFMGDFTDLTFKEEPRRITHHSVRDFGVKSFPRYGAYGFYTPKYGTSSFMVIPINRQFPYHDIPEVIITDTGTTIHLSINGDYECYRVIVRKDDFATEFITYDTEFDFIPMYDGECLVSVYGHSNEITVTSNPYEEYITIVDRTEEEYTTTKRITLTAAGWSDNEQTVNMAAVKPTSVVFVTPVEGITLSSQGVGTLTFTCTTTPIVDIEVGVAIM